MKIIVVSIAPWNRGNNFGKTFCDIFEGMKNVEFLNIYCDSGLPDNNVNAKYYQITVNDIIANLLHKNKKVGRRVENFSAAHTLSQKQQGFMSKIKTKKWRIFFWIRRFIWWIGRWRTPELEKVIHDFDADLLFLPIFKESYMNSVQQYVQKVSGKKSVAYYGDDNYTLRLFSFNPFFWLDRLTQRITVKKTIDKCEYMYVVSDIEKRECERDFKKDCYICTKGADFSVEPPLKAEYPKHKKLVYTGNLGNHRWEELWHIGQALDKINEGHKLIIYSGTELSDAIKEKFNSTKSIEFMGRVSADKIPEIQSDADVLVHVESFRFKERLLVHQSFSTKIVDHFARSRTTFAVGATDVASIDYLLNRDAAVVATSRDEIEPKLRKLLGSDEVLNEYAIKGFNCGKDNHDINYIQKMFREHFDKYMGVNS
ncbi:MAG: hypothetical protein ACI4U6_02035 [Acutalibacteraceae bacterium]